MPRGKTGLKSGTEGVASPKQQLSVEDMKELQPLQEAYISKQEGTCEPSKKSELSNNITDMSVDANTPSNDESDGSLPRKPKRLFKITGSKKKDAKRRNSADNTDNNKPRSPQDATQKKQSKPPEIPKTGPKKKNIPQSYKRQFFDDDHPYEDPSLLVNNSTTQHNNSHSKKKSIMDDDPPQSPKSIESESVNKNLKEKHPSIISETSIPRSIFGSLVALLLSLIVFLAAYFLLHCHAVLSIATAILVYVIIFVALGFMDGKRMKCLILLLLPSVCSRGARLALYLLVGYFVITGPLCNMIGNVKTVRSSLKCVNNERPEVIQEIVKVFEAAQNCITTKQLHHLAKGNTSTEVSCNEQRCHLVKEKFKERCQVTHDIPPTVCNLSQELSCMNETAATTGCPKNFQKKYCQKEFHEILEFLHEDTSDDDGCGFMEIFSMLFPLLILFVFYEGYSYENNYRTYNNFHNFFLTNHFQVIDQSRSSCDRAAVLPLRKVELRKHVRPATLCHLTDIEKKQLWSNLKTYIVFLLVVLFIILSDLYMFQMFDLKNEEKVGLKQDVDILINKSEPVFDFNKTVVHNKTTELASNLTIKANTTSVNIMSTNTTLTSKVELPPETVNLCTANFDAPGSTSKIILPILLSLLLLVILLQAHVSRIQWYICSRLYQVREKERVFYLYNKILEDRVRLVDKCREGMKCYHREMKTLNSLEITRILAGQVRCLSKIFKFFHINLRRCVVCNDKEKPEFKICHGLDCSGVYCLTCSFDIDKKCLYCDTELKHSLSLKQGNGKDISSKESLV